MEFEYVIFTMTIYTNESSKHVEAFNWLINVFQLIIKTLAVLN